MLTRPGRIPAARGPCSRARAATAVRRSARPCTSRTSASARLERVEAPHLERERHPRRAVAGERVRRGDVDPLAREDLGDVAQQALPVHRLEHDVDRETPRRAARPSRRRSGAPARARACARRCCSVWRWIVTPLPRVTKPTIGSGGAGLQQRARSVISRSTPTTRMPLPEPAALLCRASTPAAGSASARQPAARPRGSPSGSAAC